QRQSAILSLDARPASTRLFAWSRGEGMLQSTDAGNSWRRKPLNQALRSALARSVITNFTVDHDGRMYLSSHPFELNSPAQLWRSFNDGETWHAVYTLPGTRSHYPLLLRRSPDDDPKSLYMAHGNRLARTTDAGDTWTDLAGPWSTGTIRAYAADPDKHTILYNTRHSAHVAFARQTDRQRPSVETYKLIWPDTQDQPRPDIRDVVSIGQFIYTTTDDAVYAGSIPEGETQLPHAPTNIATLVVILLMTGLSFFYLRNANVGPVDST
ncbi:MAG: WD40/YVTN/BNR-like repeat-containing protein, partial [Bradymonadaceae bacterium]